MNSPFGNGWFSLRLAIPLLVIVLVAGMFFIVQPGTLAKRTISHDGSSFKFHLWQQHGYIKASCGVSVVSMGSSKSLDTSDAEILFDETAEIVTLRVDDRISTYDLRTRRFGFPGIP
jgi:hypothetical protein